MKKTLLSLALMAISTSSMAASSFCHKIEKNSTEGYSYEKNESEKAEYCLTDTKKGIMLFENSYIYGSNHYKIEGIDKDLLPNLVSVKNHLGELHLITKDGTLYTGRVGLVLSNNNYLPFEKNNKIELTKESIKNVKKSFDYDGTFVLTKDNKVFMQGNNKKVNNYNDRWQSLSIGKVSDIEMNDLGSYFLLTNRGVFSRLKDTDVDIVKGKGQRSTYERDGVFYLFDKVSVRNIPLQNLDIDYIYNSRYGKGLTLQLKDRVSGKVHYLDLLNNRASFRKEFQKPSKADESYEFKANPVKLTEVSKVNNISIEEIERKNGTEVEVATLRTNKISSRDYGVVKTRYKEKVYIMDADIPSQEDLVDYQNIKSITIFDNVLKIERINGKVRSFDINNYKEVK